MAASCTLYNKSAGDTVDIFIYSVFYMFEDIKKVFDIDKKSKEVFREEIIYSVGDSNLKENSYEMIKDVIRNNHAVGFMTGHYDENLTITNVSGFLLYNLGYDYKEFMEITKGSLKNLFYGENRSFLEIERFRKIQGEGEAMRQNIMWNTE